MNAFLTAFWTESLKAYRSKVPLITAAALLLLPLAGGLFMLILKDPEGARSLGLISIKARLTAGTADWPSYLYLLIMGIGAGGGIFFAFIAAWVFGREFSDHTAKELLALPTPRAAIVAAKLLLIGVWSLGLALLVCVVGLGIGQAVNIPGWTPELQDSSFWSLMIGALLNVLLMPWVALFAGLGRGYLPAMGWAILVLALAQIAGTLGWGDWFPWSVPALLGTSSLASPSVAPMALHSYLVVLLASIAGTAATITWWRSADQSR